MIKKQAVFQVTILFLVLIIGMVLISGRGCPKRSKNKIGNSSPEWSLPAPSGLTAEIGPSSEIQLTWQDNSSEAGFQIWRSLDGINWGTDPIATTIADTISYSDFGPFLPFTTYYYRIWAFNTVPDYSAYSNVASAITVRSEWRAIAAGESHSLALNTNGTLWGWGDNQYGQLDSSALDFNLPITRPTLLNPDTDWLPIGIEAGWYTSFGIKTNGTLWSWGANDLGQLGLGDTESDRYAPEQVGTDSNWLAIAGGGNHALALKTQGTLWSWGYNNYGQLGLGLGDTIDRYTPSQIGTASDWFSVTAGYFHSLARKTDLTLWAWGYNYFGQLGDNSTTNRTTPRQIGTASDWASVTAGYNHTIGIRTNRTLWGWGYGYNNYPTQIGTDSDWFTVSGTNLASASGGGENVYTDFTIAKKSNGSLWSWGYNTSGQLGLGDNLPRTAPVQITYPSESWAMVAAGGSHSLGLTAGGGLYVWGNNQYSQLGIGNTVNQIIPINTILPQPGNLIATVITWTQITLSWSDNSDRETGFIIERSISPTTGYSLIATVGSNAISYPDTTVTRGNAYYYRVKAVYPTGDSLYSNVAGGITLVWEVKINPISARYSHSMVWDPIGNRVIMFGGYDDSDNYKNDLWWYDPVGNTWALQTPGGTPPSARIYHSMVWDPIENRVIMFGGTDSSWNYQNDLWWYDPGLNTWTEMIPNGALGSPTARIYHSMVWDGQRVIMFGGGYLGVGGGYKNDLWWYSPGTNTWNQQYTPVMPSARFFHSMVWDTVGQRVIMFGGYDGVNKNDLWWWW